MLSTNEKTELIVNPSNNKLLFTKEIASKVYPIYEYIKIGFIPNYLYIISDDEIKEGDYYILSTNKPLIVLKSTGDGDYFNCNKIIATTDTSLKIEIDGNRGDLLPDVSFDINLPQPSQQFIEKYIEEYNKGNVITDVLVEYEEWCNCNGSIKMLKHLRTTKCDKCIEWEELKINPKDNSLNICFID